PLSRALACRGSMKKILIIGNSGSGKSWLSGQLSKRLRLKEVHLDSVVWEPGGYNQKRSPETIKSELVKLSMDPSWIVEGVFGALIEELIPHADTLLFLDLNWAVCKASLLARGSESSKQLDVVEADKNFKELLTWASEYSIRTSKTSRQFHDYLFSNFSGTKVRFTSRLQVGSFAAGTAC
ncbi:AAA family ATPase, partial [Vibrio anguillarum]|uniref:AAA family ATPase n=2 Tax=Vibrionaceae TaxID=641 RepID=UPI001F3393BF